MALNSHDLTAGLSFLSESKVMGFPWVSVNVFDSTGANLVKPHIIKTVGETRAGIIGLTATDQKTFENIVITDWQVPLQKEIDKIQEHTDIIVLLSELSFRENRSIAQQHPEIDIIISSEKTRGNLSPQISSNALITQTHDRGRYLGKLSLSFHPDGNWHTKNLQKEQKYLKKRIKSVSWQLKQLNNRQSPPQQDNTQKIAELENYKKNLEVKLAAETAKSENSPTIINTFKADFIAIKPKSPQLHEVELLVKKLKEEINRNNQQLLSKNNSVRNRLKKNMHMDFVGYSACGQCHEEQTNFWETTQHSKAYATLKRKGEEQNTDCLPCHVTTAVNPTSKEQDKLSLLAIEPTLKTIGCESCHGEGKAHSMAPETNVPTKRPLPAVCKRCHTPERDTAFNP